MTVIHANDPTTRFLSVLYDTQEDLTSHVTETSTNSDVIRAIRASDTIVMLGHGNEYGLFSKPSKNGKYERFMITDRHVQFLRDKPSIGIWCYANQFAKRYGLHGLFSGMIISELQEAIELGIPAAEDEIYKERERFALRLKNCIEAYSLEEIPTRMKSLDDTQSELTRFNYSNLYYYE